MTTRRRILDERPEQLEIGPRAGRKKAATLRIRCGRCGAEAPNKGRGLCAECYLAEYKAGRIEDWKLDRARKTGVRVPREDDGAQVAANAGGMVIPPELAAELADLAGRLLRISAHLAGRA